jgi:hypothetical protein
MMEGFSSKDFTQPRFHYGEVVFGNGATAYINNEIFKMSRPTLVDYIWIGEESFTSNGWVLPPAIGVGQHTSSLDNVDVNWWVTDRARVDLRQRPISMFDNNVDGMRAQIRYPIALPGAAALMGSIIYRFRQPWRYNPGNSMLIDWSYVTGNATVNAPTISQIIVLFYGVGVKTRHRRVFEALMPLVPSAGPFVGSFTQPEFISNLSGEPYDLDEMQIVLGGAGIVDLRVLNMLRYRIVPSQGEPFSDDAIPLLAYGIDMFPQGRSSVYAPTGGPMLLLPGQSIGWEASNLSGNSTRLQIVLVGRTAPNLYYR